MEIVVLADHVSVGELVGSTIADLVQNDPATVLGLATGSSPLPVYQDLIDRVERGGLDLSGATAFTLDEYVGLPPSHPEAYRSFIRRVFTLAAGISDDRLKTPEVAGSDIVGSCARYEQAIRSAGGVALQLLGIGSDGHIGFNEPTSSLGSRTRMKTLTDQTLADNARFFDDDIDQVPNHVVTQGIGTILEARHVVLVAAGQSKADAVAAAVEGPLTAMVPASALQLHPHATIVLDDAAASKLTLLDYYRSAYARKPEWQGI
ncbi:MAG: glucosamine-6-phosphate deaminase [Actinomycetia bacterium]|nr:glucosamine-6-phosphate deaminase [Actinomycetes bacterium]